VVLDLLEIIVHEEFVLIVKMVFASILLSPVNVTLDGWVLIVQFKHVTFLAVPMDIVTMEHVIVNQDLQEVSVPYLHVDLLVLVMVNV